MKKLILICGANGVGKSTVGRALLESLEQSAYIDSEYCCNINPFTLTEETIQLFKSNIAALMINCFRCDAIENIIFPYGFHGPRQQIFRDVIKELQEHHIIYEFCPVILECEIDENIKRMRNDKRDEQRIERALNNTRHIYDHYDYPRINTTNLTVSETVDELLQVVH